MEEMQKYFMIKDLMFQEFKYLYQQFKELESISEVMLKYTTAL